MTTQAEIDEMKRKLDEDAARRARVQAEAAERIAEAKRRGEL